MLELLCSRHFWAEPHTEALPCPSAPSTAALHGPAPFLEGQHLHPHTGEVHWPPAESKLHFSLASAAPHPGASPVKGFYPHMTLECSLHSAFWYYQVCSYKFPIISVFLVATRIPSCFVFALGWGSAGASHKSPLQTSVCINGGTPTELSYLCSVTEQGPELCSA